MLSAEVAPPGSDMLDIVRTLSAALGDALVVTTSGAGASGPDIVHANPAFETLTGYAAVDVVGRPTSLLWGAKTSRLTLARLRAALTGGGRFAGELIIGRRHGGECRVAVQAFCLSGPRRDETYWAAVLTDAGQDKAARSSNGELQAVADAVPVLLADMDADQRYLLVNRQHEAWFDASREDIVGKAMHEVIGYDAYMELRPHVQAVLAGKPVELEKELRYKTAGARFVRTSLIPKTNDDGGVTGFYSLTEDISALKRAEGALYDAMMESEAASQAKSEFLTHMSHELRTPLNAIMGFSETMKLGMFGDLAPRYQEYAELIYGSADHLLDLINGLLDLAKIEANRFELAEEEIDIAPVLEEAVRLTRARRDTDCAPIAIDLPADLPLLYADRRSLRQMFLNLLSNAVKFTPGDGRIAVEIDGGPMGSLRVRISDTGVGIAPENLETVMEPFGQAAGAERLSLEAGTGLGLPLVKSLVELHGGGLALDSELGAGTTVTLTFPANRVHARAADRPRHAATAT